MKRDVFFAILLLTTTSEFSYGAGLINGSFETPIAAEPFSTLSGSPAGFGWTISSGDVDLIRDTIWSSSDGHQSLDLNGYGPASIYQDFTFPSAGIWAIKFDMSANPVPDWWQQGDKTLRVDFGTSGEGLTPLGTYTESNIGRSYFNMQYVEYTTPSFIGDSTTTYRLRFTSLTGDTGGPVIDNVRIVAVPEPSPATLIAITTMLIVASNNCLKINRQRKQSHTTR